MTRSDDQAEPTESPVVSPDPDIVTTELKHGTRGGEAF